MCHISLQVLYELKTRQHPLPTTPTTTFPLNKQQQNGGGGGGERGGTVRAEPNEPSVHYQPSAPAASSAYQPTYQPTAIAYQATPAVIYPPPYSKEVTEI